MIKISIKITHSRFRNKFQSRNAKYFIKKKDFRRYTCLGRLTKDHRIEQREVHFLNLYEKIPMVVSTNLGCNIQSAVNAFTWVGCIYNKHHCWTAKSLDNAIFIGCWEYSLCKVINSDDRIRISSPLFLITSLRNLYFYWDFKTDIHLNTTDGLASIIKNRKYFKINFNFRV